MDPIKKIFCPRYTHIKANTHNLLYHPILNCKICLLGEEHVDRHHLSLFVSCTCYAHTGPDCLYFLFDGRHLVLLKQLTAGLVKKAKLVWELNKIYHLCNTLQLTKIQTNMRKCEVFNTTLYFHS